MASILNADNGVVSGTSGLKYASDNSGVIELQTSGATTLTLNTSKNAVFANAANVATALNIGANALTVGTSMYVVANGNVGIGNNAPAHYLSVYNTLAVGTQPGGSDLTVIGGGNGIGSYIEYRYSNGSINSKITGNNDSYLNAFIGKVGIGTTAPTSKLTIGRDDTSQEGGQVDLCRAIDNASAWGIDVYGNTSATSLRILDYAGSVERLRVQSNGHVWPGSNGLQDLGSPTLSWRNIYTNDLHLSNESHEIGNSVDGSKGSWTIQEGADYLYILNNKNGKKYKFILEEIK